MEKEEKGRKNRRHRRDKKLVDKMNTHIQKGKTHASFVLCVQLIQAKNSHVLGAA